METNKIIVIDEEGKELEMDILLTCTHPETNLTYVLYFDSSDEGGDIFASRYDLEGNLFPVEDAEWEFLEAVYDDFLEVNMSEEGCDCDEDCECDHDHEHEDGECCCKKAN